MRHCCAGGLVAALCLGLASSAARAGDDAGDLHSLPTGKGGGWTPVWMRGNRTDTRPKETVAEPMEWAAI